MFRLERRSAFGDLPWKPLFTQPAGTDEEHSERTRDVGEMAINVTEDVELWYSGASRNHGWIMSNEDTGMIRCGSWAFGGRGRWKLRITYEPE